MDQTKTMPRDYYEILGIQKDTNKKDIKSAFLKLAKQFHPDVNDAPDAEAKFKEINEAYEILYDEDKRARYDRFGHEGVSGQGGFSGSSGFPGFEEIFEEFFSSFGSFYYSAYAGVRNDTFNFFAI